MSISIALLLVGGAVLTLGDIIMKKWVVGGGNWLYLAGMAVYLLGLVFLVETFKYKNIAIASTIFVIFNVIILTLISWVYYRETLSIIQILGIVMGIAAVVVLEIGSSSK